MSPAHAQPGLFEFAPAGVRRGGHGADEASAPRFQIARIANPPALHFWFDRADVSAAFFTTIRLAYAFDPRLTLAGGRLTTGGGPQLFLRLTHAGGVVPLAEFGETCRPFFTD